MEIESRDSSLQIRPGFISFIYIALAGATIFGLHFSGIPWADLDAEIITVIVAPLFILLMFYFVRNGFESPFLINQVQTHLIFGPLYRSFPLAYLVFAASILSLIGGFFAVGQPLAVYLGRILDKLIFLLVPFLLMKMKGERQAIIGWVVTKCTLAVASFAFIFEGGLMGFINGKTDALPNLLIGIIWLPSLEFHPNVVRFQKYLTLSRIVLTIPLALMGIRSGGWTL